MKHLIFRSGIFISNKQGIIFMTEMRNQGFTINKPIAPHSSKLKILSFSVVA